MRDMKKTSVTAHVCDKTSSETHDTTKNNFHRKHFSPKMLLAKG